MRIAENLTPTRTGRLEVRPGFTALALTTYGNRTLTPYDLVLFNDRLYAFGDDNAFGLPADLFEYVNGAKAWAATNRASAIRLPQVTDMRDLAGPVSQETTTYSAQVAANNNVACLVWNTSAGITAPSYVNFNRVDSDSLIFSQRLVGVGGHGALCTLQVLVTTTGIFWIVGVDANATTRLGGFPFNPATDFQLPVDATLFAAGANGEFACAPITNGTSSLAFVVASGALLRVFSDAGIQQGADIAISGTVGSLFAVEADVVDNKITLAWKNTGTNDINVQTWNLTTHASVIGPTTLFGGDDGNGLIGITRLSATKVLVASSLTTVSANYVGAQSFTTAAHTLDTKTSLADCVLMAGPFIPNPTGASPAVIIGTAFGEASPTVASTNYLHDVGANQMPLAAKDFETAGVQQGNHPQAITRDPTTGFLYQATLVAGNDLFTTVPRVTQYKYGTTARRQTAQLGNLLYVSGALPAVFDSRMLAESGFTERPLIQSFTPGTGGGQLIGGAAYDYVATWEWLDADNNLQRSAISAVKTVTLGNANNQVSVIVRTPKSLRSNGVARLVLGSSVRVRLWRSFATVTKSRAELIIPNTNFAFGSITGGGLGLAIDGGAVQPTVFAGGDNTTSAIAAKITASVTGIGFYINGSGQLVLFTTSKNGLASTIVVSSGSPPGVGTATGVLGIPVGTTATGTQTFTKGQSQQLAQTVTLGNASVYGDFVTVLDTLSDAILRTNAVLYTESSPENFAPPPSDYIWPGSERLGTAGHPRRSEWSVSQLQFPNEPIAFSFPGLDQFTDRARGDMTAIAMLDKSILTFTKQEISVVTGSGPDNSGLGDFFSADRLPSDGGIIDARPLIETAQGLFALFDTDKLYLIPRGGDPVWIGQPIRDQLEAFPVITACCHVRKQQCVYFAITATNGASGELLRYDLRTNTWWVDTVGPVTALAEFQGRLAIIQSGAVLLQDTANGAGTFVSQRLRLGTYEGNQHVGYGIVSKVLLMGEILGDCVIEALISYDDGATFQDMGAGTFTFTSQTGSFTKEWTPPNWRTDRFVVEFRITGTANSKGVRINSGAFEVERAPGVSRKGQADTN